MREIGSEFHKMPIEKGDGLNLPTSGIYTFSGRTAIETALKDIPRIRKALLPSYCCESMIQPFQDAGISVYFYPVLYDNGLSINLNILQDVDALLWCNYFGFDVPMPDFSDFDGVVIEDITHSLFSEQQYHLQSQYLVASLRKWEPINCGGYFAKLNEESYNKLTSEPPKKFIDKKTLAMEMKRDYLLNPDSDMKSKFLSLFGECNNWLAKNYSNMSIDSWSLEYLSKVDTQKQREKRRNNAAVLYEGLKDKVQFLFSEDDMDCPLFVPILLSNRDYVRQTLIENQIYCPIHWPKPIGCESNLYNLELSLVCDQRYTEEDMERVVSVLSKVV